MSEYPVTEAVQSVTILVVSPLPRIRDARGEALLRSLQQDPLCPVERARTASLYTVRSCLSVQELEAARRVLFTDAVVEESRWDSRPPVPCRWIIQVGMLPGVTDNVGRTASRALGDMLAHPLDGEVYTSSLYLLEGDLDYGDVERLVRDSLANPLVHQWRITSAADWRDGPEAFLPPPVAGTDRPLRVNSVSLDLDDDALLRLSREGLLALNLAEMKTIQAYFGDPQRRAYRQNYEIGPTPTDVELETLAQTWSEHCKHKIFQSTIDYEDEHETRTTIRSLFKSYIVGATEEIAQQVDWLRSVFHDNAGVISFNDEWNLVMKVETHNTPSALDPYGGAITGILG